MLDTLMCVASFFNNKLDSPFVLRRIGYILNVTKEIDNFFMGMFQYYTVRLYDVEESHLLKHWDKTFKFISKAR